MGGGGGPSETQQQRNQRIKAETDNLREIREGVAQRTAANRRRFLGRRSIISGATARSPL